MTSNAVESATASLRRLLAEGRYQPGDRLPPERELAEALGLSRPTVREAIRRLMEAGLLEPRRGSGTFVASIDLQSVMAVRLQLEPFAAELAAAHRETAHVQRLAGLLADLKRNVDRPEDFAAADLEVHRTIAEASANPVLAGILERLTELVQLSRAITSPERELRKATLSQLGRLVRAIRKRDEAAAREAMEAHLAQVGAIAARWRPRAQPLAERAEGGVRAR